jgi:DGQHR domain-containing protein
MVENKKQETIQKISVIVPRNPFAPLAMQTKQHCLCAVPVRKLMEWWPGKPHVPHRNASKVADIQRSLDWRRVAQIAAYLLQEEIDQVPLLLDRYFKEIYEPRSLDPGREWPPKVPKLMGFQRSEFPTFSNVLLHVNGAKIEKEAPAGTAMLIFDENSPNLNFSVIDGQHRINGAYFAVRLAEEEKKNIDDWDIPAEVFLDLDEADQPPRRQAQIFIDVNFYQKKVDRSLVADLFPTARGPRRPLDDKERAMDIGRRLMLETGPLVGMIQIPGIHYGVREVVALATLNAGIEDVLPDLREAGLLGLEEQTAFVALCLSAWLDSSGRKETIERKGGLSTQNIAYQGRILVSVASLVPALILHLRELRLSFVSDKAESALKEYFKELMKRADLLENGVFISKDAFKKRRFYGSGGIARFRNVLWAAALGRTRIPEDESEVEERAQKNRGQVAKLLSTASE